MRMPDWHKFARLCHIGKFIWQFLLYVFASEAARRRESKPMKIGRAIYGIRKERGLKLEAVANDAGTDAGYLSRIETGNRSPSLPMLKKIATAMGVSVSQIAATAEGGNVDSQSGESDLSEAAIQLRQVFRTLTPDNQQALVDIAKVLSKLQGK
jgi:transcriptional regulator with XRE-family HTH domain